MSLFIVLLQIFRVVVIQPCEFKTRHLRKQQGNLQFCYNFSSVLPQVKGLPVAKSHRKNIIFKMLIILNEKSHRGQTHLKMTTRARAIHLKHHFLCKADKIDLNRLALNRLK